NVGVDEINELSLHFGRGHSVKLHMGFLVIGCAVIGEITKEQSKSFKSSLNCTEYKKWVEARKSFKEHDELLSMDQADQKLENGPYKRPV
ncbi:6983_t:CDS:2, partial [Funneliformis caledonium]